MEYSRDFNCILPQSHFQNAYDVMSCCSFSASRWVFFFFWRQSHRLDHQDGQEKCNLLYSFHYANLISILLKRHSYFHPVLCIWKGKALDKLWQTIWLEKTIKFLLFFFFICCHFFSFKLEYKMYWLWDRK